MAGRDWLPFRPDFCSDILTDRKRATSRNKRYGDPGHIINTPAGPVRLLWVERVSLGFVAAEFFADEGFETPADFVEVWNEIHPRAGFDPEAKVWLHLFERVERPVSLPGSCL